ncbi:MAG: TRAP transporter small permease, partial [Desulfopila sp.]|nr:TRAP transporter small permease [Desulfopila sp.]
NIWVEKSLALLGISMTLIVIAQVFFRYILNSSLFWSEELARYLLVWITFLGATSAYYRGIHPGIDILTQRLAQPWQKGCRILVYIISLGFFTVMLYHGSTFAFFIRTQISPALALPKWIIFSIIPFSGALFFLHCLVFLLATLAGNDDDR